MDIDNSVNHEINDVKSDVGSNDNNMKANQLYVYTVEDIQHMLGIGRKQAYELVNSGQFPVKKLARKFLIPIKTFDAWLYNTNSDIMR